MTVIDEKTTEVMNTISERHDRLAQAITDKKIEINDAIG
jgi:hypothetical protein